MKIEFLLTVRLTPESKGEQIDTFGAQVQALRATMADLLEKRQPIALSPEDTQVRFLVHTTPLS